MIFSDISMPGLDGLKMIAGLKSEFPDMQISICLLYTSLTGVNPDRAVIPQPEKKGIRWKFYPEYLKERQPELLFLSW